MTSTRSQATQSISYARSTLQRAERAVQCAPFRFQLFTTMRWQGVELRAIAGSAGVKNGYTRRSLPELTVENDMLWLIQTGVLRREVDGQGLTDSFRLTPLGRKLVEKWERSGQSWPSPSLLNRLYNALNRWMRLPGWLQ